MDKTTTFTYLFIYFIKLYTSSRKKESIEVQITEKLNIFFVYISSIFSHALAMNKYLQVNKKVKKWNNEYHNTKKHYSSSVNF